MKTDGGNVKLPPYILSVTVYFAFDLPFLIFISFGHKLPIAQRHITSLLFFVFAFFYVHFFIIFFHSFSNSVSFSDSLKFAARSVRSNLSLNPSDTAITPRFTS